MDNTEGSLTKEQKEILVGVLLGDGAMRKKTQALLEINHSIKQKELVDWLYAKFKDFVGTAPKARLGNGNRVAYRFTTRSLPVFTQFYDWFFKDKGKIIPGNLEITPLTLACWYMDDGSCCDRDIYLNSQQFNQEEQEKLCLLLQKQQNIQASLNKDKIYWRIRIKKASVQKFMDLIREYMLPSFNYKLLP
ncbi:hypothetical protein HY085_00935 [Candidatus Gottesmanbacteria bacterium]|nr:hypothetical protein [Candidatus Gottesmanbacteria bacterium]